MASVDWRVAIVRRRGPGEFIEAVGRQDAKILASALPAAVPASTALQTVRGNRARWRRALSDLKEARSSAAKPAGDREPGTARRADFMLESIGQEDHQRAGHRRHFPHALLVKIQAQGSAVLGRPARVQVDDARDYATIVVVKAIAVA